MVERRFEIVSVLDVLRYAGRRGFGSNVPLMNSSSKKKLVELVNKFSNVESTDEWDEMHTFYMPETPKMRVSLEDDEVEEFRRTFPDAVEIEEGYYEATIRTLYRITVCRQHMPVGAEECSEPLCYIYVTLAESSGSAYDYWDDSVISTKGNAYNDELPDDSLANDGWSNVYDIENVLDKMIEYVGDWLSTPEKVKEFNELSYKLLPFGEKEFDVKRCDVPYLRYHEDAASKLEVLKKYVRDAEEVKWMIWENKEGESIEHRITPREYIKVWNLLYLGSYQHNDSLFSDTSAIAETYTHENDLEAVFGHNPKASELLDVLKTDEDWDNPEILKAWEDGQSPYHCLDVIYARTHLYLRDKVCGPLIYSCHTHWHIDSFVDSIVFMDGKAAELGDDLNGLFAIASDMYEIVEDMYLNRDVIRFGRGMNDKYIRENEVEHDGVTYKTYCNFGNLSFGSEEQEAILANGWELPWRYEIKWRNSVD